ncbi:MAG: hypothetical protein JRF63_05285 [Deltaproteobacteria bacterium]|nr:hypothetical protein [Deltaproteobacteria bacterium]
MSSVWLLKGTRTEPGWKELEKDSRADAIDLVVFDRGEGWALLVADDPPTKYEGLVPEKPRDGLYVSEQGMPSYIVDCKEVRTAEQLIDALGEDAKKMLEQTGDPIRALERLGRTY